MVCWSWWGRVQWQIMCGFQAHGLTTARSSHLPLPTAACLCLCGFYLRLHVFSLWAFGVAYVPTSPGADLGEGCEFIGWLCPLDGSLWGQPHIFSSDQISTVKCTGCLAWALSCWTGVNSNRLNCHKMDRELPKKSRALASAFLLTLSTAYGHHIQPQTTPLPPLPAIREWCTGAFKHSGCEELEA